MYKVELYARVRRACMVEGMSTREAARVFGLHRDTVRKMLEYSVPPGYRRQSPPRRPKLDPYRGVVDLILEDDRSLPKKQRHTAKRIYDRLRAEHGFDGRYTIVKDYVRKRRRRTREMYVPLSHPPGDAQCDFGQAKTVIGGVEQTIHYFVLDLPHSDACFVKAYPAETTEAFCDGHVSAFSFLGGVPRSILYDNTRLAVARILGDGRRQRTRVFSELVSHYLFEDRFGRPGKGNDKGKVEGLVGYARRNFLIPVPSFESFDALNVHLEEQCLERLGRRLRGHNETQIRTSAGTASARWFGPWLGQPAFERKSVLPSVACYDTFTARSEGLREVQKYPAYVLICILLPTSRKDSSRAVFLRKVTSAKSLEQGRIHRQAHPQTKYLAPSSAGRGQ